MCQDSASHDLNHQEDRIVKDNRKVTTGMVIVEGGNAEMYFINAPVKSNGKTQEHGIPLEVPDGTV